MSALGGASLRASQPSGELTAASPGADHSKSPPAGASARGVLAGVLAGGAGGLEGVEEARFVLAGRTRSADLELLGAEAGLGREGRAVRRRAGRQHALALGTLGSGSSKPKPSSTGTEGSLGCAISTVVSSRGGSLALARRGDLLVEEVVGRVGGVGDGLRGRGGRRDPRRPQRADRGAAAAGALGAGRGLAGGGLGTREQAVHGVDEGLRLEGLGDVAVGADARGALLVEGLEGAREQQHRECARGTGSALIAWQTS